MVVLGIDPGTATTGYGVVRSTGPGLATLVECGVILDRPTPDDPTLYASDHLGLAATLEVPA